MVNLTPARRAELPKSDFAGPGTSFPVPDASHAVLALSAATRAYHAGHISMDEAASIQRLAHAKLRELKK